MLKVRIHDLKKMEAYTKGIFELPLEFPTSDEKPREHVLKKKMLARISTQHSFDTDCEVEVKLEN